MQTVTPINLIELYLICFYEYSAFGEMPAFCPNEPSQCPGPSPAVSEPFTQAACLSLLLSSLLPPLGVFKDSFCNSVVIHPLLGVEM